MIEGEVVIVDTGSANLASVGAALNRLGRRCLISGSPGVVRSAACVVLPGVGAFGPAMAALRERGLDAALVERINAGRPLLAICLGMQLLCESSEESPGVEGLSIVPGVVRRFVAAPRVPQMGWNRVVPARGDGAPAAPGLVESAHMYFANSFKLNAIPRGWLGATTRHGETFASAIERGPVLACQFHPELSGSAGLGLIDRWLRAAELRKGVPC